MMHWLAHAIGLDNPGGRMYLFWSGFGSDLAYAGAITLAWRHVNCHARGCWRMGRHPIEGTPFKVCRRHHPDLPNARPTAAVLAASGTGS